MAIAQPTTVLDGQDSFISVDELMGKIHDQIAGSSTAALISNSRNGQIPADATTLIAGIENDINAAESFSQVRTSLGSSARFLKLAQPFQSLVLRALAFVLRDQRNANSALLAALRKSLQLNVRLIEEQDLLKTRMQALESKPRARGKKPAI